MVIFELFSDSFFFWSAIIFCVSLLFTVRIIRVIFSAGKNTGGEALPCFSADRTPVSEIAMSEPHNLLEIYSQAQTSIEMLNQISKNLREAMENEIRTLKSTLAEETKVQGNKTKEKQEQISSTIYKLTEQQKQVLEEDKRVNSSLEIFRKKLSAEQMQHIKDMESQNAASSESAAVLRKRLASLGEALNGQIKILEQQFEKDSGAVQENYKSILAQKEKLRGDLAAFRQKVFDENKSLESEIEKTKSKIQSLDTARAERRMENERIKQEETMRWTQRISLLQEQKFKEQKESEKLISDLTKQEQEIQQKSDEHLKNILRQNEERLKEIKGNSAKIENEIQALRTENDKEKNETLKNKTKLSEELLRLHSEERRMSEDTPLNVFSPESQGLQEQAEQCEKELADSRKKYSEQLQKKEQELRKLKAQNLETEEQIKTQLHLQTEKETAEKIRLEEEKIHWEEDLARLRLIAQSQMGALKEGIRKTRQQLMEKESELQKITAQKKEQMDTAKRKLDHKLQHLKKISFEEQRRFEKVLHKRDESIKTLKLKLSWRRERIEAELKRRRNQMERMVLKVREDIQSLENQKTLERSAYEQELAKLSEILSGLEQMSEQKGALFQQESSRKDYSMAQDVRLSEEITAMQDKWERSLAEFSGLIELKEKEIEILGDEIKRTEKILESEERKTHRDLSETRKLTLKSNNL